MNKVDCRELSLKKVKINGDIIGKFGTFEIEQTFKNNKNKVLEVFYTFPIVETATVAGFEVIIGDKVLKGKSTEKKEAKKNYQKNLVKGNSAYLLEQKTENIFTIAVGKLDRNEEVKIKIKYIDKFEIIDNEINVFIPTIITPRYKSKITEKLSYDKVDYNADFTINIAKSVNVESIKSSTNTIKISQTQNSTIAEILDFDMCKDFKLSIKLKEELSSTGLISKTRDDKEIVYLSFMPETTYILEDSEKEYLFLIDVSGSMSGTKMEETKRAVKKCLLQLDIGDKFNIIQFEYFYRAMSLESLDFNEETLAEAIKYIDNLKSGGGTEILSPLKFALYEENTEKTILLFTDGQVGEESEILEFVEQNIGKNHIFPFGIDDNVNAYFIRALARIGNGKAELIQPNEKIENKIFRTFERIQSPLVEEIKVNYKHNKLIDEIRENSTLFNYEFYNVFAKLEDLTDDIELNAIIANDNFGWEINKDNFIRTTVDLEVLFVKQEIDRLEKYVKNAKDKETQNNYINMIIDLAVKYNINSNYTSFLTVYERENKILDIPTFEETKLGDSWLRNKAKQLIDFCCSESYYACDDDDMYCSLMEDRTEIYPESYECHSNFIPNFIKKGEVHEEKRRNLPDYLKDIEEKTSIQKDENKEYLKEYYSKNIYTNSLELEEYLLFTIYYLKNEEEKINIDNNKLYEYLMNNKEKIQENKILQELVIYIYDIIKQTNKTLAIKLLDTLDKRYKKAALTEIDLEYNLHRNYTKEELEKFKKLGKIKNILLHYISE